LPHVGKHKEMMVMAATATVFHILPGKTPECLEFNRIVTGDRHADHEASRYRLGITLERAWVETTNAGDVLILYYEAENLERAFQLLTESNDPYDLWYKERFLAITGVDLNHFEAFEPGELVFESPHLDSTGPVVPLATVLPVRPGLKTEWRQWLEDLNVSHAKEFRAHLERYGFTVERFFLQLTPRGPMAILYAEGADPAGSIASFARSNHPFDAWMREEMLYLNGIDFIRRATAPPPDLVLDWKAKPKRVAA